MNTFLAQAFIFLAAGYETTKTTMLITTYYLAKYPKCQEEVLQEINQVLNGAGDFTHETVGKLNYLNNCILEGLR